MCVNLRYFLLARKWVSSISLLLLTSLIVSCGGGGGSNPTSNTTTSCTSPSVQSLQVSSVTPANNTTEVSVNSDISATFNACVDMSSVSSSSFIVTSGGFPLSGRYSFDQTNYTLSFTPSNPLRYDGIYAVVLSNTIKGNAGESFTGTGWGFFTRTAPDLTPPVTNTSVTPGNYNLAQSVELVCDDGIDGTGCATSYYTTDGSTPDRLSSVYTTAINISSDTELKYFSVDVDNNSESVNTAVYIIDTIPPSVTSTTPGAGETDLVMTTAISASFDEPILEATLTGANFTLDNGVTGSIVYDSTTNTATLTPGERLECNTQHNVTLSTEITDLAGNQLIAPVSWNFTSHTDCIEPVTTANVPGGVFTTEQLVTLSCTDGAGSGCARLVYTVDGSVPSFSPINGTIISGDTSSPISIVLGDTSLRFFAEDNAGNREVLRDQPYSISNSGYTFITSSSGALRGIGQLPDSFTTVSPERRTQTFFTDTSNGRAYRGTEFGLYYSDNLGQSWHKAKLDITDNSFFSVNGLFARGSKVYAATTVGLYVSIDGGGTYQKRYPQPVSGSLQREWIYHVYATADKVYLSTSSGLGVSTDKGNTFIMHSVAREPGIDYTYNFAVDGDTIYAANSIGLGISVDGGNSFTLKTTADGLASDTVNSVVLDNGVLYIATTAGLSISTDSGTSFTNKTSAADGLYSNLVSDIYINGSDVYLATGSGMSISNNAGASFNAVPLNPWSSFSSGANAITALGSRILLGAYPSYFETVDNGTTWLQHHIPNSTSFMDDIVIGTDGIVHILNGDFLITSRDKGHTYTARHARALAGDFSSASDLYMDGNTLYIALGPIAKSTDGGDNFTFMTTVDNGLTESVSEVYANGSTLYAATSSGHLNKSTDGGANFTLMGTGLGNNGLAVFGQNVYLGNGSSGLNVSGDGGVTFSTRTSADGLPPNTLSLPSSYIEDVVVDAPGNVFVQTLNNGNVKSEDNGSSFTPLESSTGFTSSCGGSLFATSYAFNDERMLISTDAGLTFTERSSAHGLGRNLRVGCYTP